MFGGKLSPQMKLVFQCSTCYQMTVCNSAFSQHLKILFHSCCEGLQCVHTVCVWTVESEMSVIGLAFLSNTSFGICML